MSQLNPFVGKWQILYLNSPLVDFINNGSEAKTFTVYQAGPFDPINRVTPVYWVLPNTQGSITPLSDSATLWASTFNDYDAITVAFRIKSESAVLQLNADLSVPSLPASQNPPPGTDHNYCALGVHLSTSGWDYVGELSLCWRPEGSILDSYSIRVVTSGMITVNSDDGNSCHSAVTPGNTTDFTYIDISQEVYSYLSLSNADFSNSMCVDTNFIHSVMDGAAFGGSGSYCGADFYSADLSGATFTGGDFTQSTFQMANLCGAHFSGCCLRYVNFQNAELRNCTFTDCDLTGAAFYDLPPASSNPLSFSGCTLDQAQFQPLFNASNDLSLVSFVGTKSMVESNFKNTILNGTNFDKALLAKADFTGADFTGTLLTNVDLRTAIFSPAPHFSKDPAHRTNMTGSTVNVSSLGADWSNMDLSNATIEGLPFDIPSLKARDTVFKNVQLTGSNLPFADFTRANLQLCDMSSCNLSNGVFTGALMQGDKDCRAAVLSKAQLLDADFTGANLTGTQFTEASLSGANLSNAIVICTDFTAAYLTGVKFVDLNGNACRGSNFAKACLINTSFNGTDCSAYEGLPTSFAAACLQGADFTNAKLFGADLTAAGMSTDSVHVDVMIPVGWPVQPTLQTFTPAATRGVLAATDTQTTCPSGLNGPCTSAKQQASGAPTTWP